MRSPLSRTSLAGLGALALSIFAGAATANIDLVRYDALDLQALNTAEQQRLDREGGPTHFAVRNDAALSPHTHGTVTDLADGRKLWRLRIDSQNARNVNLGMLWDVPPSTRMYLLDANGNPVFRAFTAEDIESHGELWTPVVDGSVVEIHAEVNADEFAAFADGMSITSVNLGFQDLGVATARDGELDVAGSRATDACHIDVECSQADPWRDQVNSVAAYTVDGFLICSGAMLNNTARDFDPLFMTAYHCFDGFPVNFNPSSMVVYWNYQNSVCRTPGSAQSGQNGDGSFGQATTGGAQLLMSHSNSDFVLVRLNNDPDPSYNVVWAGWDNRTVGRSPGVGIHHPGVEEKRISFENNVPQFDTVNFSGQPNISCLRVVWDAGGTEGGSSGSPYFNSSRRVVGTLTAGVQGAPICTNQFNWYGRLDVAWNGGGTPSTRLRDYLDPINTGEAFIDGLGTASPPEPFNLLTPTDGATDVPEPPVFVWEEAVGFDTYTLRVFPEFSSAAVVDETLTVNAFTAPTGIFQPGDTYRWIVLAQNAAGTTAATGGIDFFTMEDVAAPCPEDIDGDNTVGTSDLLALLAAWGTTPPPGTPEDIDQDGAVGTSDLLALLAAWGTACP